MNPDAEKMPNENDAKCLEYYELLLEALEAGAGYRVEYQDTLYIAPTPLIKINSSNLFHSDSGPAIRWKGAEQFFYLNGVNFPEALWSKVVSGKMPFQEILAIEDIDQRTQAMRYGSVDEFMQHVGAKTLDTYQKFRPDGEPVNYTLYEIPQTPASPFTETAYYMRYSCPSTNKDYMSGVPKFSKIADAMAWKFSDQSNVMTPDEWRCLVPLITES